MARLERERLEVFSVPTLRVLMVLEPKMVRLVPVALVKSVLPVSVVDPKRLANRELKAPVIVVEPRIASEVPVALEKRVAPVSVVEAMRAERFALSAPPMLKAPLMVDD